MNKRYQLIKPLISDKIYETSSMIRGAKKCYNEIKLAKIAGINTFAIRDIDSRQTYEFKIHNPYNPDALAIPTNTQLGGFVGNNDRILRIENKIKNIEEHISQIINSQNNHQDECTIL